MEVTAPMLANVWKVCVREGERVSIGDALVILESMKMEIPIEAPCDGWVRVLVDEGDVVEEDGILAVVDPV